MGTNQKEFFERYVDPTRRNVVEIDMAEQRAKLSAGEDPLSPMIIIKDGPRTMILNPMAMRRSSSVVNDPLNVDYLDLDIHSFIDGQDATAGGFGMSNGARFPMFPDSPTSSQGWQSASLVVVLLGEQS